MLIKDKDILAKDEKSFEDEIAASTKRQAAQNKIDKKNMREAWGDAFDYYLQGITSKYLNFHGRATRLEFWGYAVVASLLFIPLNALEYFSEISLLSYYYALATLIPTFAVASRRLHDINKRSAVYLAVTAVLTVFCFINPLYAIIPTVIWYLILFELFSKASSLEAGLYGIPLENDEIYGSDNEPILSKFKIISIVMLVVWFGTAEATFDNWKRQAEQKGTIEVILEEAENEAIKRGMSADEAAAARQAMYATIKKLQGQAISEEEKDRLVSEAVKSVRNVVSENR